MCQAHHVFTSYYDHGDISFVLYNNPPYLTVNNLARRLPRKFTPFNQHHCRGPTLVKVASLFDWRCDIEIIITDIVVMTRFDENVILILHSLLGIRVMFVPVSHTIGFVIISYLFYIYNGI